MMRCNIYIRDKILPLAQQKLVDSLFQCRTLEFALFVTKKRLFITHLICFCLSNLDTSGAPILINNWQMER